MALVNEVVNWAVLNSGNVKPIPPSPAGGRVARQNQSLQEIMGSIARWRDSLPFAVPGGADTQIQFNDGGVFGGDADLVWSKTANKLTMGAVSQWGLTATNTSTFDWQSGHATEANHRFSASGGGVLGQIQVTNALMTLLTPEGEAMFRGNRNAAAELFYNGVKKFETTNTGAIVTGALTVTGAFTSLGIDDNATAERLQLTDSNMVVGPADTSQYGIIRALNTGVLALAGGNAPTFGGNIQLRGGAASNAGDVLISSGVNTVFNWDESAGSLAISTGVGAKTTALTINLIQDVLLAGNSMIVGAGSGAYSIEHVTETGLVNLKGGNATGGRVTVYGGSHGTKPGDIALESSGQVLLAWDESVGDLEILTGIGSKTRALLLAPNQDADFSGRISHVGTGLVTGDFALSAGWGTTASVSLGGINDTDQHFFLTVFSAGTGQGSDPTIVLTFTDGAWGIAPVLITARSGGNQSAAQFHQSGATTTTVTISFRGTPVATESYAFVCFLMG